MQFCKDIPWVLATGGSKGELAIWDCSENKKIEDHFKGTLIKGSYDEADYDIDNKNKLDPEAPDSLDEDGYEDMEDSEEDKKKKKKSKKDKKDKK